MSQATKITLGTIIASALLAGALVLQLALTGA
jgi:hypothetical protein